ncbi:hypothetical protein ACQ4PT_062724 [Festuca glaucescens]
MGTRKRSPAKPRRRRSSRCKPQAIAHGTNRIRCTPLPSLLPPANPPKSPPRDGGFGGRYQSPTPSGRSSRGRRPCCRVSALAVACMREGRANGAVDREGGGADAAAPTEAVRRPKQPQSNPSSSGSAASSSSGGGGAAEEEQGGKNKQGRRRSKRREEVLRAIRDRLPAAPSCWGNNVSVVQERRGRRGRPDDRGRNGGGDAVEVLEEGSGAGTAAAPAWCCLCPEGDCSLEANPSANGKEDPGLRSLLERNDFYSDDCNPHAPAAAAVNDDDGFEAPAADFD